VVARALQRRLGVRVLPATGCLPQPQSPHDNASCKKDEKVEEAASLNRYNFSVVYIAVSVAVSVTASVTGEACFPRQEQLLKNWLAPQFPVQTNCAAYILESIVR